VGSYTDNGGRSLQHLNDRLVCLEAMCKTLIHKTLGHAIPNTE